jgi:hypothetical protein
MDLAAGGMKWCIERRVKVRKVLICEYFGINVGSVTAFLHISGASVENFWISNCTDVVLLTAILGLLSFSVRRLQVLVVDDCGAVDATALGALLSASASSLRRLKLSQSRISAPLAVPRLPNLDFIQIYMCTTDQETLCKLVSSSPNLRSFSCSDLYGTDLCLEALASHCPLLQVLAYENGEPSDVSSLVRLLHACPDLEVVEISSENGNGNPSSTDAHITAIMQHCRKLKAFCGPASGPNITNASVMAVASRLDDMRHLWLSDIAFQSDQPMLALSEHCRNLTTLDLHANQDTLSESALVALMSNLHSVVQLGMEQFELTDRVLKAIAVNCPRLEVLDLYSSRGYTEVGIVALARGCTALERVRLREDDEIVNPAARLLWKELRPGLKFYHNDAVISMWDKLYDIDRDEVVVW